MKSLHISLNEVLKEIPNDCTFNQDNFKTLIQGDAVHYSSIDLKSATELMPATWQAKVLSWLANDEEIGNL
jgi:hypothetical protein